jgi:lysophospholipase L1-like esterase
MDHVHLTKAGHQTLADLIAPTLREALFKSASD